MPKCSKNSQHTMTNYSVHIYRAIVREVSYKLSGFQDPIESKYFVVDVDSHRGIEHMCKDTLVFDYVKEMLIARYDDFNITCLCKINSNYEKVYYVSLLFSNPERLRRNYILETSYSRRNDDLI